MKTTLLALGFFVLSLFCSNAFAQVQSSMGKTFDVHQYDKASIQFLIIKVYEEAGVEKVELLRSRLVPGHLKKGIDTSLRHHSSAPPFVCSILDENKKSMQSIKIPNPLVQSLEYHDEHTEELARQEVTLEEETFLIRVAHQPDHTFLKIEKETEGQEKTFLGTLKIQ